MEQCDYCDGEWDQEACSFEHEPFCVYYDELFGGGNESDLSEVVEKRDTRFFESGFSLFSNLEENENERN